MKTKEDNRHMLERVAFWPYVTTCRYSKHAMLDHFEGRLRNLDLQVLGFVRFFDTIKVVIDTEHLPPDVSPVFRMFSYLSLFDSDLQKAYQDIRAAEHPVDVDEDRTAQ
jgi:hypothetical protein